MKGMVRQPLSLTFSLVCGMLVLICAVLDNLVQVIELSGRDLNWLQAYVVAVGTSPGVIQIMVLDEAGTILAHTDPTRRFKTGPELPTADQGADLPDAVLVHRETGRHYLRLLQTVDFFYEGIERAEVVLVDLSLPDGHFFLGPNHHLLQFFLLLFLVSVCGIVLIFLFLDRRVLRVARHLRHSARRIAQGDFTATVEVHHDDELGDVSRTFNEMAAALGQTMVSKDFFDKILRFMAESVIVLGPDLTITLVNEATLRLLGANESELLGSNINSILLLPEGPPDNPCATLGLDSLERLGSREGSYRGANGQLIPVLFSAAVMRDETQSVLGIVLVARYITDRKRFEQELTQVNADLQAANDKLKSTQAQLVQSAKLASLGEMATGIAHELNQPLQVIGMSAELARSLNQCDDTTELNGILTTIVQQVQRAAAIINHLRTFGRESSHLNQESHQLNQLVEQTLTFFQTQFRLHQVQLALELAPALPEICCNPIQLEQVVSNLLHNAWDAVELRNEKRITIRTTLDQGSVLLQVSDNGCGIPAAHLARIFDPFFTTKEIGKGTGLGLSISYGIIKEHGGELSVASHEGQGSTFMVRLPVVTGE